ncbi:alanine--tRNA ligase [Thiohalobacter sp. IOR34]|uniref:alanine--tRNA ligase n=1 Tax=Thiohalobacter sp. IOR34 TaxID=3057176 RepID=UPI0025B0C59C|nr:alanine--tRNA ligase [Thiohalobacter sp. IOR34]WJW74735.1 alanine--tRNA ligase [Thiohalobacter sp. IOR34]
MISSAEIRTRFLDYFRERGHEIVPSSPLVPADDPTLLFTNAGMVQFKEVFTGRETRPYTRAASSQRCVRAGGKHNDLENVGYTARHHTFFEMLGNFSFGDYFKREAIHYAWELLTREFKLPPERLWVTVYEEDDEAADIWLKEIGVDPARFSRIGDKPGGRRYESDNFWSMGDTGPCGPCSEIFYDHGPEIPGGPPGTPEEDGDRYIEIWNLVFMQYDRDADGNMTPLPKPSVDTGMGLERLAAVLQGVHNNYDIDLFRRLIEAAARLAGCDDLQNTSLRVIADHIRACAFLVTDGVVPSNEGRGYVLRRIIRRAIRHGHKLGLREPFFFKLVAPLCEVMGDAYPELVEARPRVEQVLRQEEERFAETLDHGMALLEEAIAGLEGKQIPGETVFRLYDTYGFPVDLTADIARERGLRIDMEGFEREMAAQRERARAASSFSAVHGEGLQVAAKTEFTGYDRLHDRGRILALFRDGEPVERLGEGEAGLLVLDRTPFYAESGGQVGDTGVLRTDAAELRVLDTQKQGEAFLHRVQVERGAVAVGDSLEAEVVTSRRREIAAAHSATHLLHAALRQVLGEHVQQKGSLVEAGRLRFDFSHFDALTPEQLAEIETLVNAKIRENLPVETRLMSPDEARAAGAMALFGEKYGDIVRVLSMGDFSVELCGGTHVQRTGDIGLFKIVSEGGVAAGVRRIEAVAGQAALDYVNGLEQGFKRIAGLLKADLGKVEDKVQALLERNRGLEKELERLKARLASSQGGDLAAQAVEIGGIRVLAAKLEGVDPKSLRDTVDQLKNKLGHAAVVLAAVDGDKVSLVAGVTKAETDRLKAGELVNFVARQVGGKGGGRPDLAMAGGKDPSALDAALAAVPGWIETQLGGGG